MATAITTILRQALMLTRRSWKVRLAEAFLCSMLSSAIIQVIRIFTDLPPEIAFPVCVFTGFLGTDFIRAVIVSIFKIKVGIDDPK